ncbi:MAG: hypothetical protein ACREAC_23900 [Blastocatellia bacterium]
MIASTGNSLGNWKSAFEFGSRNEGIVPPSGVTSPVPATLRTLPFDFYVRQPGVSAPFGVIMVTAGKVVHLLLRVSAL